MNNTVTLSEVYGRSRNTGEETECARTEKFGRTFFIFNRKKGKVMKLILKFTRRHWLICAAAIILLILDVMGGLFIPTLAAEMLNLGTSGAAFEKLLETGVKMLIYSFVSGACGILGGYACAVLASRIGKDIRTALYEKSLKLSVYDFRQFGTASITTRTVSDVNAIQYAINSMLSIIFPVPAICIVALILSFRLDTRIGFLLLLVIAAVLILAYLIMHSAAPLFRRLQKLLDKMSVVLLENITGVRVVRAFNSERREKARMDDAFCTYAQTSIKANRRFACLDGLAFFFINFFVVVVYFLSGTEISLGNLQIGDITALIEYAILVLFFLMMAQMEILTLPRAMECSDRIRAVLEHSPEIVDHTDRIPNRNAAECKDVLNFSNVSFRFADAEENTLSHLNFTCRRGETTAIIGGTGSGKSTVASLILRFHDVTEGSVMLNGTDVREMPQSYLRDHISYVQQKAWLFSGTIAENLRYSNKNAGDEELMHAADVAQAGELIRSLPDGLNAYVAQGGTNFSGGQRQRLSIARALVKKPELYIFDDSFSALDFKTDAALRRALAKETSDAAVLIIAQRVSTIRHAEQIIVLNDGQMVGKGTHDELMQNCPVYQEIYRSQTKEEQQ